VTLADCDTQLSVTVHVCSQSRVCSQLSMHCHTQLSTVTLNWVYAVNWVHVCQLSLHTCTQLTAYTQLSVTVHTQLTAYTTVTAYMYCDTQLSVTVQTQLTYMYSIDCIHDYSARQQYAIVSQSASVTVTLLLNWLLTQTTALTFWESHIYLYQYKLILNCLHTRGCFKLWVIFRRRDTTYRALLRKMTHQ